MGIYVSDQVTVKPQKPNVGNRMLYPKSDGWYEQDATGLEQKVFSSIVNPYGTNYIGGTSQGLQTNTSETPLTYQRITYPAGLDIPTSLYEVEFCCLCRYSSSGRNQLLGMYIDGVLLEEEISYEHNDTGSEIRVPLSYKYLIDGTQLLGVGGFIDFMHRSEQNGDSSRIYSATVTFKRVK